MKKYEKNTYYVVGTLILFTILYFLFQDPIRVSIKGDATVKITDEPVVERVLEPAIAGYSKEEKLPDGVAEIKTEYGYVLNILRLKPTLDPAVANEIGKAVYTASLKYDIPGELIIAIMLKESSFNITAVSKANCLGLMQVNPATWKEEMTKRGLTKTTVFHIHNNVDLGTWIFQQYYHNSMSVQKALVSYLGALDTKYVLDILDTYANLTVDIVIEDEKE